MGTGATPSPGHYKDALDESVRCVRRWRQGGQSRGQDGFCTTGQCVSHTHCSALVSALTGTEHTTQSLSAPWEHPLTLQQPGQLCPLWCPVSRPWAELQQRREAAESLHSSLTPLSLSCTWGLSPPPASPHSSQTQRLHCDLWRVEEVGGEKSAKIKIMGCWSAILGWFFLLVDDIFANQGCCRGGGRDS